MGVTVELDERLVAEIDDVSRELHKNRIDFIDEALRDALNKANKKIDIEEKERKTIESYRKYPVQPDEFYVEEEQLIEAWKDL